MCYFTQKEICALKSRLPEAENENENDGDHERDNLDVKTIKNAHALLAFVLRVVQLDCA